MENCQNSYKMMCISILTTIVFPLVEERHKLEMTFKSRYKKKIKETFLIKWLTALFFSFLLFLLVLVVPLDWFWVVPSLRLSNRSIRSSVGLSTFFLVSVSPEIHNVLLKSNYLICNLQILCFLILIPGHLFFLMYMYR